MKHRWPVVLLCCLALAAALLLLAESDVPTGTHSVSAGDGNEGSQALLEGAGTQARSPANRDSGGRADALAGDGRLRGIRCRVFTPGSKEAVVWTGRIVTLILRGGATDLTGTIDESGVALLGPLDGNRWRSLLREAGALTPALTAQSAAEAHRRRDLASALDLYRSLFGVPVPEGLPAEEPVWWDVTLGRESLVGIQVRTCTTDGIDLCDLSVGSFFGGFGLYDSSYRPQLDGLHHIWLGTTEEEAPRVTTAAEGFSLDEEVRLPTPVPEGRLVVHRVADASVVRGRVLDQDGLPLASVHLVLASGFSSHRARSAASPQSSWVDQFGQATTAPAATGEPTDRPTVKAEWVDEFGAELVDPLSLPAGVEEMLVHTLPFGEPAKQVSARTDSQGRFAFCGLERDRDYHLHWARDEYTWQREPRPVRRGAPMIELRISQRELVAEVRSRETGKLLRDAKLTFVEVGAKRDANARKPRVRPISEGKLVKPGMQVRITATCRGYRPSEVTTKIPTRRQAPIVLMLESDDDPPRAVVELWDPSGRAVTQAHLSAVPQRDRFQGGEPQAAAVLASSNRAILRPLSMGTWILRASPVLGEDPASPAHYYMAVSRSVAIESAAAQAVRLVVGYGGRAQIRIGRTAAHTDRTAKPPSGPTWVCIHHVRRASPPNPGTELDIPEQWSGQIGPDIESGAYTRPLIPGTYTLTVRSAHPKHPQGVRYQQAITIEPGSVTTVDVDLDQATPLPKQEPGAQSCGGSCGAACGGGCGAPCSGAPAVPGTGPAPGNPVPAASCGVEASCG